MNSKKIPYKTFNEFVLRTPILPFQYYLKLTESDKDLKDKLLGSLKESLVEEAIFLASPTLYFELQKWIKGELDGKKEQRVQLSLLKYLSRMSSRCTPFGLFAGCSLGQQAEKTEVEMASYHDNTRFTRPDMNYLVALSLELSKKNHIKNQLTYYPNSSIYVVGNLIRYIEYYYVENKRQHQIIEIENNEYLNQILNLSKNGATIKEILGYLSTNQIPQDEILAFIDELLDSQILISDLEPSVSGPPFISQMVSVLEKLKGCEKELSFLKKTATLFEELDDKMGNPPEKYLKLSQHLKQETTHFELKYLFQTDIEPYPKVCSLGIDEINSIKKGITLFNKISSKQKESNLTRFITAFRERYEEREMPLCHVLDVETGIGYLQNSGTSDINPLVDDLLIPPNQDTNQESNISINRVYALLFEKTTDALKNNRKTVFLKDDDFKGLLPNWDDLPDTFSSMVELVNEKGKTKIRMSGSGGSSAAVILGRFCHEGSKLTAHTKSIVNKETALASQKILAEIVHLPESRVGNILMRPELREFEIPYLAKSIKNKDAKISLNDLFISIRNNKIYLRSKKHNKEVIPRLTNAHNYSMNALPIYHFLADMQFQDIRQSIGFNFGPLDKLFDFLPRVECGNLILHEARWRINNIEIDKIISSKSDKRDFMKMLQAWLEQKGIPKFVLLVDGDNELLINFNCYTSALMLFETVKRRTSFILKEFLHHQGGVVLSKEGWYTNQVVISFYKENNTH